MSGPWDLDDTAVGDVLERLRSARSVLFPTHQNVDADGLASPLAIVHALHAWGVEAAAIVSDGQLPGNLRFLPGIEHVLIYGEDPLPDYDLLCLVDCSDRKRLGAFYRDDPSRLEAGRAIINIDHHVTNDRFGLVNIVVPYAASTAEIVADLLDRWGVETTPEIAQCLLAGIYGDTLGLRTEATTAQTMRTAARLMDAGANPASITDQLFRLKPRSTVCLWERALSRVQWTGEVIWTEVALDDLTYCEAIASEAEGLVNFLAGTEGSRASAILYQVADGWRVSMRSLPVDVDVAAIASEFGGGGHPRAAGCQVVGGQDEKHAFLDRVAQLVRPVAPARLPSR